MNDVRKDVEKIVREEHRQLLENLLLLQHLYSIKELSEALGISRNTWKNRMEQPWRDFSYDDLRTLSRYCGIKFTHLVDGELKVRGETA